MNRFASSRAQRSVPGRASGVVPAGRYDFREGSISYQSDASRTLSGQLRVGGGGYFQGDRQSVGGNVVC